jgi:hypothetical protein
MPLIRKFTIGVLPFAKMFRVHGLGGAATDAVLKLRGKGLPDNYFEEIGVNAERTAYRLSGSDQINSLHITEESITFTKDYHEAAGSFSFKKTLDDLKLIWPALQSVLFVSDIRRIGMVAEYRYSVPHKHPSVWLRQKLLALPSALVTDKFSLRFEERDFARDGIAPDPKKADFINYIYHYYDSAIDASHPEPGFADVNVDVQRYFAPMLTANVMDECAKLYRHFEAAESRMHESMTKLGATDAKR